MHHAEDLPDWELVQPEYRNRWQQIAAETSGIVTPGNAVTVAGHLIAMSSVIFGKTSGSRAVGFLAGRSLDVIDGTVASRTGTKSPTGAKLDAVGDKLSIGTAVIAGMAHRDIPRHIGAAVIVDGLLRTGVTGSIELLGGQPRPNLAGKWSAAGQSFAIGGYAAANSLKRYPSVAHSIETVATIVWGASQILGVVALTGYVKDVRHAAETAKNTAETD